MQIVNIIYALYLTNRGFHPGEFHPARRAFEQNVQRLAHDAEACPEDQRANAEGKCGVDPRLTGHENRPAAGNDSRARKRVADLVQERAADVYIAIGAI